MKIVCTGGLIFSGDWTGKSGRKPNAYSESLDHLGLVKNNGYELKIFRMKYSRTAEGTGKIRSFERQLIDKRLLEIGSDFYAVDEQEDMQALPEIVHTETFLEGYQKEISATAKARNTAARAKCIDHFGYDCQICFMNFEVIYGELGKQYIHVHHKNEMSDSDGERPVDPLEGLIPVCPNCHMMMHRTKPAQSIEAMRDLLARN